MKISIHQPNFMPWMGYFKKIANSDTFVILDNVQSSKNSYLNRNIFSANQSKNTFWMSIPVSKKMYKKEIQNVFSIDNRWINKHLKYFQNEHNKTSEKFFLSDIKKIYESNKKKKVINISDFNLELIKIICKYLDIHTNIVVASKINFDFSAFQKQDLVIEIIKYFNADTYISGTGAIQYQEENYFHENNINLTYNKVNKEKLLVCNQVVSIVDQILREGLCQTKHLMTLV